MRIKCEGDELVIRLQVVGEIKDFENILDRYLEIMYDEKHPSSTDFFVDRACESLATIEGPLKSLKQKMKDNKKVHANYEVD